MSSTKDITYSFVKFYYQNLHENPAKLSHVYTNDAHLTHSQIPEEHGVNFISKNIKDHSFSCKKDIEAFYANSKLANSKIRLSSIDFQSTFENSIFISALGELALKDEVAVYRFTQSFILKPAAVANTYDICNDIFRLIPDEDYELNNEAAADEDIPVGPETTEEQEKPSIDETEQEDETISSPETETASEEVQSKEPSAESTPAVGEEQVEEVSTKTEEPKKDQDKKKKSKESSEEPAEEKPTKPTEESETEEVVEAPKQTKTTTPSSWAQAVLSSTPKPAQAQKPKATKATASKKQQEAETPAAPSTDSANAPKQQSSPQPASQQNSKKKSPAVSDLPFTVHVKNVENLNAEEIRKGFEKEFGRVVRAEPRGHWALVAFETQESMTKALAKKVLKIEGSPVHIDQKPAGVSFSDKKKSGSGNGGVSKASSKDKQQKSSNRRKK